MRGGLKIKVCTGRVAGVSEGMDRLEKLHNKMEEGDKINGGLEIGDKRNGVMGDKRIRCGG